MLWGIERRRAAAADLPGGRVPQGGNPADGRPSWGWHVADKPDSQEICFVPDQDHARFVRQHRGAADTAGEIVTTDGTVVGRHEGLEQFTVGQRKGLGIAFGEPRYVVRLEPATRRVVVGDEAGVGPPGADGQRGQLAGEPSPAELRLRR